MTTNCNTCSVSRKSKISTRSSWLSALLVIIIPKCPICIMAYTSAITMCGGHTLYETGNNWVSFIPLILSVIILVMIVLNRKGARTYYALGLASVGFIMILLTHQLVIDPVFYNFGTALLFLAIWLNSNLLHALRHIYYWAGRKREAWLK